MLLPQSSLTVMDNTFHLAYILVALTKTTEEGMISFTGLTISDTVHHGGREVLAAGA